MPAYTEKFNFPDKFTEKHLNDFMRRFYDAYLIHTQSSNFLFDFSRIKWISNQNLLVIAGVLKYLFASGIKFYVRFLPSDYMGMEYRTAKQIVEIWETWKIIQVVDESEFHKYFDLDADKIRRLKEHKGVNNKAQEIYDYFGVTPLIVLDKLSNYTDNDMNNMLGQVLKLDQATSEILKINNCSYPFENNTVNYILIKELYENFLDHFNKGALFSKTDYAFTSLSLVSRLKRANKQEIPNILKKNLDEEYPEEYRNFFLDKHTEKVKNQAYIHLSFLDFGEGIPGTLIGDYKSYVESNDKVLSNDAVQYDSNLLAYAFRFDSSRHPLADRFKKNISLPRGLFDVLSIVKRYEGLLVVQSNAGKILYDFSGGNDIKSSVKYVTEDSAFFPGTLISIYIPEREKGRRIDYSAIKPVFKPIWSSMGAKSERFINIFKFQADFKNDYGEIDKEHLYNQLFERLSKVFRRKQFNTIYYVDFTGHEIDIRLTKKIIYFLISDYSINNSNNIIVVHPPSVSILEEINSEILALTEVDRKFRIHPTPFVYLDKKTSKSTIFWLGIYDKEDLEKLQYIQSLEHGLRRSDFKHPDDIVGHVNLFDKHGNLVSILSSESVLNALEKIDEQTQTPFSDEYFEGRIEKYDRSLFLLPQNFYQEEYLNILEPIADNQMRGYLAKILAERIDFQLKNRTKYLVVTFSDPAFAIANESSFKLVLEYPHKHIPQSQFSVDSTFLSEIFQNGDNLIIITECLYSGKFMQQINDNLPVGVKVFCIGSLVNTMHEDDAVFVPGKETSKKVISLFFHPIKKIPLSSIRESLISNSVRILRINPYTGQTIRDRWKNNDTANRNLLTGEEFLSCINPNHIKAGYFQFNNLIHPYFFDMDKIMQDQISRVALLTKIFDQYNNIHPGVLSRLKVLFYPKNSAIVNLDFDRFKNRILKNQRIEVIELDRQSTSNGWRYSYIKNVIRNGEPAVPAMILDDGSCTGESLMQMIDELALQNISELFILTLISRLSDHKRELFSRMKVIKGKYNEIKVDVAFGCHWHVPTYHSQESPVTQERTWLKQVRYTQNLPSGIRKLCTNISEELKFRPVTEGNNQFLLKSKSETDVIVPLLKTKNEVGKLSSFRYYVEDFRFFNQVMRKYATREASLDRYQSIELLSGVFLHEQYLYKPLTNVIPDVIAKIEEFSGALIFGNILKKKSPKLDRDDLTYEWGSNNIAHLFFIVYTDAKLFSFLTPDRLLELILECGAKEWELDYLFYNLLKYVPLNSDDVAIHPYSGAVRLVITGCIELKNTPEPIRRYLKRFLSFLNTLPSHNLDFNAQITFLKEHYGKLKDSKHHKNSIRAHYDIIRNQLKTYAQDRSMSSLLDVHQTWDKMAVVFEGLLSLSSVFPEFFGPVRDTLFYSLAVAKNSLRASFGEISDLLKPERIVDVEKVKQLIDQIFHGFIDETSDCFKIFNDLTTGDLYTLYEGFKVSIEKEIQPHKGKVNFNHNSISLNANRAFAIPAFYVKNVAFEEILGNFRNCDNRYPIELNWIETKASVTIDIKNQINSSKPNDGTGLGMLRLASLRQVPGEICTYKHETINNIFHQRLIFKR